MSDKIGAAALNNAVWIDTVCLAHECSTGFRDSVWFSFDPTPPFYPNAVTLDGPDQSVAHHKVAQELRDSVLDSSFAIKDSFCTLSLEPLGFRILFEAQWIYKASRISISTDITNVEWEIVETSDELSEWEYAWAGDLDVQSLFLPGLLDDPDIRFVAARQNRRIIAGCVANVAAGCVGISNIFLPKQDEHQFRKACVSKVQQTFSGLPVVGYESGSELTGMQDLGFETIGPLRVWVYECGK